MSNKRQIVYLVLACIFYVLTFWCCKQNGRVQIVKFTQHNNLYNQYDDLLSQATITHTTEQQIDIYYTENDVIDLAKLISVECKGMENKTEKACVIWCVLNRCDLWDISIHHVLRQPNQFAFSSRTKYTPENYELSKDVLQRWNLEKNGYNNVGRVLPKEYMWFYGNGSHNFFRDAYDGKYNTWKYLLESPYMEEH